MSQPSLSSQQKAQLRKGGGRLVPHQRKVVVAPSGSGPTTKNKAMHPLETQMMVNELVFIGEQQQAKHQVCETVKEERVLRALTRVTDDTTSPTFTATNFADGEEDLSGMTLTSSTPHPHVSKKADIETIRLVQKGGFYGGGPSPLPTTSASKLLNEGPLVSSSPAKTATEFKIRQRLGTPMSHTLAQLLNMKETAIPRRYDHCDDFDTDRDRGEGEKKTLSKKKKKSQGHQKVPVASNRRRLQPLPNGGSPAPQQKHTLITTEPSDTGFLLAQSSAKAWLHYQKLEAEKAKESVASTPHHQHNAGVGRLPPIDAKNVDLVPEALRPTFNQLVQQREECEEQMANAMREKRLRQELARAKLDEELIMKSIERRQRQRDLARSQSDGSLQRNRSFSFRDRVTDNGDDAFDAEAAAAEGQRLLREQQLAAVNIQRVVRGFHGRSAALSRRLEVEDEKLALFGTHTSALEPGELSISSEDGDDINDLPIPTFATNFRGSLVLDQEQHYAARLLQREVLPRLRARRCMKSKKDAKLASQTQAEAEQDIQEQDYLASIGSVLHRFSQLLIARADMTRARKRREECVANECHNAQEHERQHAALLVQSQVRRRLAVRRVVAQRDLLQVSASNEMTIEQQQVDQEREFAAVFIQKQVRRLLVLKDILNSTTVSDFGDLNGKSDVYENETPLMRLERKEAAHRFKILHKAILRPQILFHQQILTHLRVGIVRRNSVHKRCLYVEEIEPTYRQEFTVFESSWRPKFDLEWDELQARNALLIEERDVFQSRFVMPISGAERESTHQQRSEEDKKVEAVRTLQRVYRTLAARDKIKEKNKRRRERRIQRGEVSVDLERQYAAMVVQRNFKIYLAANKIAFIRVLRAREQEQRKIKRQKKICF